MTKANRSKKEVAELVDLYRASDVCKQAENRVAVARQKESLHDADSEERKVNKKNKNKNETENEFGGYRKKEWSACSKEGREERGRFSSNPISHSSPLHYPHYSSYP